MVEFTNIDIVYVTAECIVGVMSVLGNLLVLLAIFRTKKLQTVTNCFIGSLAMADLLVGLIIVPVGVLPKSGLPKDFHGCILLNTAVVLITNISILSLVDVALERYLAISDPFRYQRIMSKQRALVVVIITWVVAILIGLIPTLGWNLGSEGFEHCEFTKVIDMRYMVFLIFFGVNIPPLLFMLVIYLYIFHIIRKQQRRMVAQLQVLSREEKKDHQKRRREVRGAKGLAYVIILFAVCWFPLHVMNSISLFSPETANGYKYYYETLLVCIVLSHVNSMINPFLYAFSNSKFKRAMRHIVCCGKLQESISDLDSDYGSTSRVVNARSSAVGILQAKDSKVFVNKQQSAVPAVINMLTPIEGNGHVNVAFDSEPESEEGSIPCSASSQSSKKTISWKTVTDNLHGPSHQKINGVGRGRTLTEDAVVSIGNGHVYEICDDVHRSPGHVWATLSSQRVEQNDFTTDSVQQNLTDNSQQNLTDNAHQNIINNIPQGFIDKFHQNCPDHFEHHLAENFLAGGFLPPWPEIQPDPFLKLKAMPTDFECEEDDFEAMSGVPATWHIPRNADADDSDMSNSDDADRGNADASHTGDIDPSHTDIKPSHTGDVNQSCFGDIDRPTSGDIDESHSEETEASHRGMQEHSDDHQVYVNRNPFKMNDNNNRVFDNPTYAYLMKDFNQNVQSDDAIKDDNHYAEMDDAIYGFVTGAHHLTDVCEGDVHNDFDIHETENHIHETNVDDSSQTRTKPQCHHQVSVEGVSVQTDEVNTHPHHVKHGREHLSVTFSVRASPEGKSLTDELGSKEFVSIRL